jgi:hypothetical protein
MVIYAEIFLGRILHTKMVRQTRLKRLRPRLKTESRKP